MGLGDDRNNKQLYESSYYSRIKFKDYNNKLSLGFRFKSGMLVIGISKEKDGFQYEQLIEIYLTSTKAKILLEQIELFEDAINSGTLDPAHGYGINAGLGEIVSVLCVHATKDNGKAVLIGKVDNSGNFVNHVDFNFNSNNFHYGLEWNDIASMESAKKNYYNDLEFELFKDILTQFANISSGAIGYSVADITRYDHRAILNKMNPVYDKLGIERYDNNSGGNNNGNTPNNFMNSPSSSSSHKSYDEIDEELPFH